MEQLTRDVWLQHVDAEGFPTVGAVVLTRRRAFVIDTLTRPADMEPARALLHDEGSGRRLVVVNTHHHWDHVYGNAAFAGEEIVAHDACPGLLAARLGGTGEAPPPPAEGVPLPSMTFAAHLTYADGPETIRLIHAPGHSEDSVVVFLDGVRILFAGDALEWPLPSLGQHGRAALWLRTMRRLRELDAAFIVPSHGPAMGRELLDANERYLTGLVAAVAAARRAGARREDLDLPATRFVAPKVEISPASRGAHAANVARIWDDA